MAILHESIVFQMRRTATSTGSFTISSQTSQPKTTLVIECITVTNLDSAAKIIDVGVKRNEKEIIVDTVTLTTAGYYYKTRGAIHVPSDWRVIVKVRSPTAGDRYVVNVFGYLRTDTAEG